MSKDSSKGVKPLLVAVDDGYAQTKLVGESPDGTGTISILIRSSVRPGRYGVSSLSGAKSSGAYRTEEGEDFTVSEDVEAESTRFDGFHTSPMNRALVHHALVKGGYGGRSVDLIAGLPVADFFRSGDGLDREKIAAKKLNLSKGVTSASGLPLAKLGEVRIGCQAVAAFVDYLLDDDLVERVVPKGRVAVVDIGGRTTDVAVVMNGEGLDDARSGTANIGVMDVYDAVARGMRAEFGIRDAFPMALLDGAVRTGLVPLWGEEKDVKAIVEAAVREQETKIAREVERRLGGASNVDVVLFVGGGAAVFPGVADRFRNGRRAEDPEFANARGLLKYVRNFSV